MKMRSKMQNEKGFTLVELMVVVVILGILVAIAVPVYNSVQERAAKNACFANMRTIDGMKTQWNLMEVSERPTDFDAMFTAFPTCPSGGTYTNSGKGTEAANNITTLVTSCGAGTGEGAFAGHGSYQE